MACMTVIRKTPTTRVVSKAFTRAAPNFVANDEALMKNRWIVIVHPPDSYVFG